MTVSEPLKLSVSGFSRSPGTAVNLFSPEVICFGMLFVSRKTPVTLGAKTGWLAEPPNSSR